jgi:hypothetical protein
MKIVSWFGVVTVLVLIAVPCVSDAFSRRTTHSEIAHSTPLTTTSHESTRNDNQTASHDVSAQAVPEPPVVWLMSVAVGLLAVGVALSRLGQADTSAE